MLRGLASKWKQPVYYNYDCAITNDIVFIVIKALKNVGYVVVALVNDLGGTNRAFFNSLEISPEQPWFEFENERIYMFADVPHLIKLLRNHFIDSGFDKEIKKTIIEELLTVTSSVILITHKISNKNLEVRGPERQKVKYATKLFSHTVAQAITRAASLGHLHSKYSSECSQLFKIVNDWFDVMNIRVPRQDSRARLHGYGLHLDEQNKRLDDMEHLMTNMRVIGKRTLMPFQKGIIQSTRALKMLYADIKPKYHANYILTYNLNQDVLENFFGLIRCRGVLLDHPDQQEFKYRLRSYLLGTNGCAFREKANVCHDDTPDIIGSELILSSSFLNSLGPLQQMQEDADIATINELEYDSIEYFAGYVYRRLKNDVLPSYTEQPWYKDFTR